VPARITFLWLNRRSFSITGSAERAVHPVHGLGARPVQRIFCWHRFAAPGRPRSRDISLLYRPVLSGKGLLRPVARNPGAGRTAGSAAVRGNP